MCVCKGVCVCIALTSFSGVGVAEGELLTSSYQQYLTLTLHSLLDCFSPPCGGTADREHGFLLTCTYVVVVFLPADTGSLTLRKYSRNT